MTEKKNTPDICDDTGKKSNADRFVYVSTTMGSPPRPHGNVPLEVPSHHLAATSPSSGINDLSAAHGVEPLTVLPTGP